MGGYMGFGMAAWIYKQRPRKAFSPKRSKPSCNTLDTYNRTFKLQPSKEASRLYVYFSLMLIALVSIAFFYKIPEYKIYSENLIAQKVANEQKLNNDAFQFLMQSGTRRLKEGYIVGAYSEFKLAHQLYPNNKETNRLLFETICLLCENENNYCKELDTLNLND